jgi:N-methylhydantoinase A
VFGRAAGLRCSETVEAGGAQMKVKGGGFRVPILVAGSGPKTLRLAGQIADVVLMNVGVLPEIAADGLRWIREGAEAVAVCLLHSYRSPEHERRVGEMVRKRLPGVFLSLSVDVLPEIREYERTSTTVVNAYIGPLVKRYLDSLSGGLKRAGVNGRLRVMQSNGGVAAPAVAGAAAASTLLSGPAAAPTAGAAYTAAHGLGDFITVDMGGTSFDVCLVKDGAPAMTSEGRIGRYPFGLRASSAGRGSGRARARRRR